MRDIRVALSDHETENLELSCGRWGRGYRLDHPSPDGPYGREYAWDWTYEGLASRILGAFVAEFDPAREDGWVAERGGATVGSIFLMKSDDPRVAKLRLLYVEPSARGAGVGRKLVDTASPAPANSATASYPVDQRHIGRRAPHLSGGGVPPRQRSAHHSFGHDLVGQTWTLD